MCPSALDDISDPYIKARLLFLPSTPIREPSRLYGRAEQLERIRRELRSPGRSVFIFGDRGVGKTSLAQTAAFSEDNTEKDPELVRCYQADFSQLITKVARHFMGMPHYAKEVRKKVLELKIGGAAGHILHRVETQPNELVRIEPLYAVDLLKQVVAANSVPVVVVDEMDLASPQLKQDLAHFIKQLGDEDCPVKFIFTGIAKDVDELLSAHQSASRAVASVRLEPLVVGDLLRILDNGFRSLDIGVPDIIKKRIALMSDGFAYFTHLLGLKLAERALDAGVDQVGETLLENAIADAVADTEVELKRPYELAVKKYHDRYETLLWGLADHWQMDRSSKEMWRSYLVVCRKRFKQQGQVFIEPEEIGPEDIADEPDESSSDAHEDLEARDGLMVLSKAQFPQALHRLKQKPYGEILESPQRGWYRFRLSMMRGYCRLMAARQGIGVGLRYLDTHNRLVDIEETHR
jgi:uncharacterized protein